MKIMYRGFVAGLCLCAAEAGFAMAQDQSANAVPAAEASADEGRVSARAFLGEVDQVTVLASKGDFGAISAEDFQRLLDARQTIHRLLADVDYAADLSREAHIELFNAQEEFAAVIRDNERDRRICKKVSVKGTRIPAYDCSSVAFRDERARLSQEFTLVLQRAR